METVTTYGILSLLPVAAVIITAIITKRALEPLLIGTLLGFFIISKQNFVFSYLDSLYLELGESAYFVVIFGLFGIFIKLLENSNAISGFTRLGLKFAKNKKKTGVLAWGLGIVLFLDNYFSILGAGVASRKIADENKMSREMFAFAINAVACSTCVLVPLSLWGVFMGSQIETLGILPVTGIQAVTKAVPFMFFAWFSLAFVLLYQLRIIKPFGPMKLAEERAEKTGEVLPLDHIVVEGAEEEEKSVTSVWNFAVPMIVLIGITLYAQELTYGLLSGIIVCLLMYIPQKMLKFGEAFDSIWTGFQDMFVVTAIVISAFVLQNANDVLGLAPYVIEIVSPLINVSVLPFIAFIVLLILGFVTGSFWGMAAVCFPIMIPLAETLGADIYLTIGAVIAGAAAGSATCFYGDSVTLTCGLAKIKNIDYARTALPMLVPVIVVTAVAYLIAGFII